MIVAALLAYTLSVPTVAPPPPVVASIAGTGWAKAAHVRLDQDLTYRRGDQGQTTEAYVEGDDQYIYIAFVCKQTLPLVTEQHTNNSGVERDDFVSVKLWPGGRNGIVYSFKATPSGIHDQSSSENTAFSPPWDSVGHNTSDGFVVMMRIPRKIMHGDGRVDWPIQFSRVINKQALHLVWAYDQAMTYEGDSLYAGIAQNIGVKGAGVAKPSARFQPYLLAQSNAARAGGSATRAGFDFSIPAGTGTSFYGTVHPDYSEVERDQQTIAPSQFQNRYREVRPFFTQGANYFNSSSLYTPGIPTPRFGYAFEGTHSNLTYAGFDAVGHDGRDDNAESVYWISENHRYSVGAQRVSVRIPGFADTVSTYSASIGNGKHFSVFGHVSSDIGTNVLDLAQGHESSLGMNVYGPNQSLFVERSDTGAYYAPADGFVTVTDAHGYRANYNRQIAFQKSALERINFDMYADRFVNRAGQVNQTDSNMYLSLRNHHQTGINFNFNTSRGLTPGRGMVPYDQSGIYFYDSANTRRQFGFGIFAGRFYDGFLRNVSASLSVKVRPQESINASEDRYIYTSPAVGREVQRLDSLSYSYQYSKNGSLAAGVRWISGQSAYFTPSRYVRAANITFSLDQRFKDMHLYVVYGNPNARHTVPSFIMKLVRFIGAGEGS